MISILASLGQTGATFQQIVSNAKSVNKGSVFRNVMRCSLPATTGNASGKLHNGSTPRPALQGHRTISAPRGFRIALPIPDELPAICHMSFVIWAKPGPALRAVAFDTPTVTLR